LAMVIDTRSENAAYSMANGKTINKAAVSIDFNPCTGGDTVRPESPTAIQHTFFARKRAAIGPQPARGPAASTIRS